MNALLVGLPHQGETINTRDLRDPINTRGPLGRNHIYWPHGRELFGRILTLHVSDRITASSRLVAFAALNEYGLTAYDEGWASPAAAPTGDGGLLALRPGTTPTWLEVDDVAATELTCGGHRIPYATHTVALFDRNARIAAPAGMIADRPDQLHSALAHALLNPAALDLWKAAPNA